MVASSRLPRGRPGFDSRPVQIVTFFGGLLILLRKVISWVAENGFLGACCNSAMICLKLWQITILSLLAAPNH